MDLDLSKQDFISVDKKTALNAYGVFFTVGEEVGHEGSEDTATIVSFEADTEMNEVKVNTTRGWGNIDFLIKLDE